MVTEIRIRARRRVALSDLCGASTRTMAAEVGTPRSARPAFPGRPVVDIGHRGVQRHCEFTLRFGKSAVRKNGCPLPSGKVVLPGVGVSAVLRRTATV